jgi:hypothetical protein
LQGWFTLIISRGTLHRGKVRNFPFSFFGRLGHIFFARSKIHYFPNLIRLEARKFIFLLILSSFVPCAFPSLVIITIQDGSSSAPFGSSSRSRPLIFQVQDE